MRRLGTMLGTALVLLLCGCAAIPMTGTVKVGVAQNPDVQSGFSFTPPGPAGNASPADIVRGFVEAATGQQHGYAVARSFLTPAFARRWDPDARVLVHATGYRVTRAGDDVYTVTVPTVARVDARGSYTVSADPSSSGAVKPKLVPLRMQLTRTAKGWRIATAPDGIVLLPVYFARLFQPTTLAFFDPTFARTVPDLRWYPNLADVPDAVLAGLTAGPAGPLAAPVAVSAIPARSRVASVRVSSGVASVDLATPAPLSAIAVQRVRAQVQASIPGVSDVRLVVDGVSQGDGRALPTVTDLVPDPNPLVRRGTAIGYLEGSDLRRDTVLGRQVQAVGPLGATVSDRQRIAAVRTSRGVQIVTPTTRSLVDPRAELVDPSLDPFGWTWSVPRTDPQGLTAFDTHRHAEGLGGPFTDAQSIDAIEVSRDGTRLLVLLRTAAGPIGRVVGIVRDGKGTPTSLSSRWYSVPAPGLKGIDATWIDSGTVAILTSGADGDQVTQLRLGGAQAEPLVDRPGDATAIVGGAGATELTVLLQGGGVARHNPVWRTIGTNVSLLAVQR